MHHGSSVAPMDSTYHVGDRVRIVDVDHCVYGKNGEMENMVGSTNYISRVFWEGENECYRYSLRNDPGHWSWDDSCFEFDTPIELPMFDASEADIFSLLS